MRNLTATNTRHDIDATTLLFPSIVRYHDDFIDKGYAFSDYQSNEWPIRANGTVLIIKFSKFNNTPNLQRVIKIWACDLLLTATPSTVGNYVKGLTLFESSYIVQILNFELNSCRQQWDFLLAQQKYHHCYQALKSFLRFAAANKVGSWSPSYIGYISSSLPLPPIDKYAAVRSGDVFIDIHTEARIVRWIYDVANTAKSASMETLTDAGMLVCNYQFAMRPKQIGLLRRRDLKLYKSPEGLETVHLTFRMLKQRNERSKPFPLVRKVKKEWISIFLELACRDNESEDSHLFGFTTPSSISARLKFVLMKITGQSWCPTDLRHSGAMRQVDAGANAEELAEFMGHSSLDSGMVYYDTSATQAERVNRALGLSSIYNAVAKIGSQKFISTSELSSLKSENQIGGAPHGIPITGIGACTSGQPQCPYNPITACYGCPRFIATSDIVIHQQVLTDFRQVVRFFYDASREENQSPAYLQLTQTINEVQSVIANLISESEDDA